MSRGAIALASGIAAPAVFLIDGRLVDTDFFLGVLPDWLFLATVAASVASIIYGLYQLTFNERNKFAIGGICAAAIVGTVIFLTQSDTGPSLALIQSAEESDFQEACKRAGNSDDACDCTWDAFEGAFDGLHLKVLIASLARDQEKVRQLMDDPAFDHTAYFGSVLKQTPAIERRCKVAF